MKPIINLDYLGCFGSLPKRSTPATAIVIHHTCTSSPKRTRDVLIKKKCSTHFEVGGDGTVYQYADINRIASHCGSANCRTVGIDVTHLEGRDFNIVQLRAVKELVEWLCSELNIPLEVHEQLSGIYPHRALGNTKCPDNFPMEIFNQETI